MSNNEEIEIIIPDGTLFQHSFLKKIKESVVQEEDKDVSSVEIVVSEDDLLPGVTGEIGFTERSYPKIKEVNGDSWTIVPMNIGTMRSTWDWDTYRFDTREQAIEKAKSLLLETVNEDWYNTPMHESPAIMWSVYEGDNKPVYDSEVQMTLNNAVMKVKLLQEWVSQKFFDAHNKQGRDTF